MQNKKIEARDLVRTIIDEGLANGNIDGSITTEGEEIRITKTDDGSLRFDLPGMTKAFVLMSGRLYEREYVLDLSGPEFDEDEKPSGLSLVVAEPSPVPETNSEEGSGETGLLNESDENESPELEPTDQEVASSTVQQLDYKGNIEEVDAKTFKNRIDCECGNVRWVKNADLFQVKKCKPCTYRDRLNRRKKSRKERNPSK